MRNFRPLLTIPVIGFILAGCSDTVTAAGGAISTTTMVTSTQTPVTTATVAKPTPTSTTTTPPRHSSTPPVVRQTTTVVAAERKPAAVEPTSSQDKVIISSSEGSPTCNTSFEMVRLEIGKTTGGITTRKVPAFVEVAWGERYGAAIIVDKQWGLVSLVNGVPPSSSRLYTGTTKKRWGTIDSASMMLACVHK